jgi:hypothetical protein
MHILCASGGVCQYQINSFCNALVSNYGFSLQRLDEFQQSVILPKGHTPLRSSFFRDRVSPNADAHIKAFAGEVLSAMGILQLFCTLVLQPVGELLDQVSLVSCMCDILDILVSGDRATRHVARLKSLCLRYHTESAVVMPRSVKPKMHYMHHVPQQIARHGVNLSCFAPERKHQFNKQLLRHIYRHMEVALVARDADEILRLAQDQDNLAPIRLQGAPKVVRDSDLGWISCTCGLGLTRY